MADLDPTQHTIDELDDRLDELDDPETLREIRDAETDGEDRTGAVEAIDERLDAVTDDGDNPENDDADDADDGDADDASTGDGVGILEVRNRIRSVAADLIGRPLDGITEVRADDDGGWYTTVEVIERNSIPDTQDILGRYEIDLDDGGNVTGYRRLRRYRRGDTDDETFE